MASAKSTKTAAKRPARKQSNASVRPKKSNKPSTVTVAKPRQLKPPTRRPFKRNKKYRRSPVVLPSVWKLTRRTVVLLRQNWKVIGGIVVIYGLLNLVLVRGVAGSANVGLLKQQLDLFFHGISGHLAAGASIFTALLTSSSSVGAAAGPYQLFLLLITSLALVWTFRQVMAGNRVRIRDGFYQGAYPLVPVLLVLLVVGLELLPLIAGTWLFSTALQIAANSGEIAFWGLIFLLLASVTFYFISSSLFALYIATLPDITPMKALRSARRLVRYRRWMVVRKLLFLLLILLIVTAVPMLPIIWFVTAAAQWVFFALLIVVLAVTHAYLYTLYRELLNE